MVIIERVAVRAIVLAPGPSGTEVLMLRLRKPPEVTTGGGDSFWITPGGGLEPGEATEAGLRRELREELGLEGFTVGPLVWRRQHTFDWDERRFCQRESFHVVQVARKFDPVWGDPVEAQVIVGSRWWTLAELREATERVSPSSLLAIIERFLVEGAPREVPEVEVVED